MPEVIFLNVTNAFYLRYIHLNINTENKSLFYLLSVSYVNK